MAPQKFAVSPHRSVPLRPVPDSARSGSSAASNRDAPSPGHPFAPEPPAAQPNDPHIEAVTAALGFEPPEHFICPITLAVMRQPMTDCHGHTFDALGIVRWLSHTRRCPINRKPLWPETLRPNLILAAEIVEWRRLVEALNQDPTGPSDSVVDEKRPERPLAVSSPSVPTDAVDSPPRAPKPREFLSFPPSQPDRRPWWAACLLCGARKETCSP